MHQTQEQREKQEEHRLQILELVDDDCKTTSQVLVRIRELRNDAMNLYNYATTDVERKAHWRTHEHYDELARVSPPRKISSILATLQPEASSQQPASSSQKLSTR
jgi:hypothetical protein